MADEALPGTARANTHSERFRDAMTQMRARTDLTAKGLAAVGTAAVSAIGYAKLADLFPYGGPVWALLALIAGMVGMIVAVVLLVRRFFGASQVVITSPDLCETVDLNELDKVERRLLERAYDDSAKANKAKSLEDLETRGHELEEKALNEEEDPNAGDAEKTKADHRHAERILAEVQAAQDRGAAFIVRRRATYALFGWPSLLFLALFVFGWYGTALGADALESRRKDQVEVAVACADAREKTEIVKEKLPDICGEDENEEEVGKQSPGQIKRDAIVALVNAHVRCRRAARRAGRSTRVCRSLGRSVRASRRAGFFFR
jgi:hypothetical protein